MWLNQSPLSQFLSLKREGEQTCKSCVFQPPLHYYPQPSSFSKAWKIPELIAKLPGLPHGDTALMWGHCCDLTPHSRAQIIL